MTADARELALKPQRAEGSPRAFTAPSASAAGRLRVGGLVPLSTVDFPGRLAAVVFCQGCCWRCRYCHNPHLLARRGDHRIPWSAVTEFLERRRGLLDAVVFSGGEPTVQRVLADAMRQVRALGFEIGLHTAGARPDALAEVLPLVEWVGVDIKAPRDAYAATTGVAGSGERAWKSLEIVLGSTCSYEVRTPVDPSLVSHETLRALASELARLGVRRYAVQEVRDTAQRPAGAGLEALRHELGALFPHFELRAA
jgi:pyruvate formate lyase activating enzyme